MGRKTVGNDLDNAWINFSNVRIPKTALLNRFANIVNNKYEQSVAGIPAFHMIGQRLFSGRVAVAQAALEFRRSLFARARQYTDNKECWTPDGGRLLSTVPHLHSLYQENDANQANLDKFVGLCEEELSECLLSNKMPSVQLVEAIAAAKVSFLSFKKISNLSFLSLPLSIYILIRIDVKDMPDEP